ncbi:MAG: iron-containing redox enzyme family protein [Nocardioidaceae bacterium]|nr:iron-containing redox enzyme family protein [Nocardioidaceae bacterium]
MELPTPRGPVSAHVVHALRSGDAFEPAVAASADVLGDDAQVALWVLLQLHYRDFDDAARDAEWDVGAVALRQTLAESFVDRLRGLVTERVALARDAADDVPGQVMAMIGAADGPSLAAYLHREATREQVLSFLRQRSLYALKESDAHSFVLPRVHGSVKVALAELQYDEYGAGRPDRLHAGMYAEALVAAGLDPRYGRYVDEVAGPVLAVDNLISVLALQRRTRAASLGQLAAFEATSSLPSRRIAAGIERVGLPRAVAAYFDEHVEADAAHEQIALRAVCGALVAAEPELADDVLFGAAAYLELDERSAVHLLARWRDDEVVEAAS